MKILEVKYPKNLPSEIVISFTGQEAVTFVNSVKAATSMNEAFYCTTVAKKINKVLDEGEVV